MQIVEKESWPRREVYEFFAGMSHPFYALTFPVDVTPLRAWCKERGLSFYAAMVYGVTKAMERVDAFLYKDRGGQIVKVDRLVPSFTDLHPGSEQFHIVTLEAGDDLADFCRRGMGIAAWHGGTIVAGASSYAIFDGGIEIEIDTHPDFRQRGLATACGAALVLACLERGLYPSWDAHTPISLHLAEKLGYVSAGPYPVYLKV